MLRCIHLLSSFAVGRFWEGRWSAEGTIYHGFVMVEGTKHTKELQSLLMGYSEHVEHLSIPL